MTSNDGRRRRKLSFFPGLGGLFGTFACLLVGHPRFQAPLVALGLGGERVLCCPRCGAPLS